MSYDWYNKNDWYRPLETRRDEEPFEKNQWQKEPNGSKSGKKKGRIAGLSILLLVIAAAFLLSDRELPELFRFGWSVTDGEKTNRGFAIPFGESADVPDEDEEYPDTFGEFFENFYTEESKVKTEIDIAETKEKPSFAMELTPMGVEELTLQEIYAECAPFIVGIEGYENGHDDRFNWGTGIILTKDGIILTNTHVVNGCDSAVVIMEDNTEFEATLIGADGISDLALLKIDAEGLKPAVFGDSTALMVGDSVVAIGNPLGSELNRTMTDGIISAIERGVSYNGRSMNLIQTNAALNEGNSGGALLNMYGQVIGITNMKMMSTFSSIEGIGFAIPSATVKTVINSIIQYGEVLGRPSIGITVGSIPESISTYYAIPEGLYITDVSAGSDAEAKGIRPGDILTAVNGKNVKTTDEVLKIKNELCVGDLLELRIWRDGKEEEITIILMETNDIYEN